MAKKHQIGILTGGGDVPGLNAVIKSVVYQTAGMGYEVLGIRRGWEGLTQLQSGPESAAAYLYPLNRNNTRDVDRTGGTMLHTSRTNPRKMREPALPKHVSTHRLESMRVSENTFDLTPLVMENIAHLGLDYLIAVGGDDTLGFAKVLDSKGVPIIAIPKTMDNDVQGTEYCIGFSTAISRAKEAITRQRSTLASHERIGIFRIFGRNAGFTALYAAFVTSGRCVVPEVEFNLEHLIEILIEDKRNNPSKYSFVIVSEGAAWHGYSVSEYGEADGYGHRKKVDVGQVLGEEIHGRTGEEIITSDLTYDLRSGEPDAIDQIVAITFANVAVDLIREGISGRMTAIQDGKYTHIAIPDAEMGARKLDIPRMYNTKRYRPHYAGKLGLPMLLTSVELLSDDDGLRNG